MRLRDLKWEIGCLVFVVFLLPPGLWFYRDITAGRQLQAKLDALRAQGMPVTIAGAAPQPVPDEENAAVLYQQVFQVQFGPGAYSSGRNIGGLSSADQEVLFSYYREADRQLTEPIRELLTRPSVQRDLEVLRRASQRPHCVFPVNWEDGVGAVFPHFTHLRQAARTLSMQTHLCASGGDIEEAMAWCEVSLRMSEHAASEPTLIAQLVAIAMQAISLEAFQRHILPARIPPAAADRFERYLREIDMYESFTRAIVGERAMGFEALDRLYHGADLPYDWDYYLGPELTRLYLSRLCRPLHKLDKMIYLDHMGKQIQISKLPARSAMPKLAALETDLHKLRPWQGILTIMLYPRYARISEKRDEAMAQIGLCRIALMLKNYKQQRGHYPADLPQLRGTVDCELPEDPFTGQPFVYQLDGAGFELYSVGPDLDDDGGIPWDGQTDDGDLVWECDR